MQVPIDTALGSRHVLVFFFKSQTSLSGACWLLEGGAFCSEGEVSCM